MAQNASNSPMDLHSIRDTVESIWVAIVLAFVLRAFLIEAFVIPTGSMAPRLLGEHWELTCDACGYEYAYGAPSARAEQLRGERGEPNVPVGARCPNCAYPYEGVRGSPSSGDRVLVLKYLYRFVDPQPWDVVVFKNPQNNHENYIKRLVGLPGETIEIVHGDIFVAPSPSGPRSIRTKPKRAQDAMWQVVYDNDYQPDRRKLQDRRIVPRRWEAEPDANAWDIQGDFGRRLVFHGGAREQRISFGVEKDPQRSADESEEARRQLFLPTYGYNSPTKEKESSIQEGKDVCTDLRLSFTWVPRSPDAAVSLALSSFDHHFRGELRADGTAALYYCQAEAGPSGDRWMPVRSGKTGPVKIGCGREVALTHVDFTVTLWADGDPVLQIKPQDYPESYDSLKKRIRETRVPAPLVKIGAQDGPSELLHVKLMRDVYYTDQRLDSSAGSEQNTGRNREDDPRYKYVHDPKVMAFFKIDARRVEKLSPSWGMTDYPITLRKNSGEPDLDEFFVLGDNSPQSLDGRAWTAAAPSLRLWDADGNPQYQLGTVPRYALLGRAMFVYWPAGYSPPFLPGLPIIPNVGRMRLIR